MFMHSKFEGGIWSTFEIILHTVHEMVENKFENLLFGVDTVFYFDFVENSFKTKLLLICLCVPSLKEAFEVLLEINYTLSMRQ